MYKMADTGVKSLLLAILLFDLTLSFSKGNTIEGSLHKDKSDDVADYAIVDEGKVKDENKDKQKKNDNKGHQDKDDSGDDSVDDDTDEDRNSSDDSNTGDDNDPPRNEDGEENCPENWDYRCTLPLDEIHPKQGTATDFCGVQDGYTARGDCHIEPGPLIDANECCRFG